MFVKESSLSCAKVNLKEAGSCPLGYASTNIWKRASIWSMFSWTKKDVKLNILVFLF